MEWHLQPALDVVDWLWASNRAAFAGFVQHGRELEEAMFQRLKDADNNILLRRTLYRSLHISARVLEQAIDPCLRLGILQNATLGTGEAVKLLR